MTERNTIEGFRFKSGEVYLLHTDNPNCPDDSSLWVYFSNSDKKHIRVEAYTTDLRTFTLWKPLPTEYRYCRPATREELREFMSGYAYYEALMSSL